MYTILINFTELPYSTMSGRLMALGDLG